MLERLVQSVKRNPLIIYAYNSYLNFACRSVVAYIFVATTGRSGSESLRRIFSAIEGSVSLHEPHPIMLNEYVDNIPVSDYSDKFNKLKRIYIKRSAAGKKYYIETNHLLIKNFAISAIKEFKDKVKIIHLTRDPISVARSLYQLGSIPGKTKKGRLYLIDPDRDDNCLKIPDLLEKEEFGHDIYRCFWYWYEIEARIKSLKSRYPEIAIVSLKTTDLNDQVKLSEMFESLNIPISEDALRKVVGTHSNLKSNLKNKVLDIPSVEEKHFRFLAALEERFGKNFWKHF
jgi:Sulfotransferase domain